MTLPLVHPRRIQLARQLRRQTQKDLAVLVGVQPATISQYENGSTTPSRLTLRKLAEVLGVPETYFLRANEPIGAGFNRKLARTPAATRHEATATAAFLHDLVVTIEQYVNLPSLDLPRHPMDPDLEPRDHPNGRVEAIEEAADTLRVQWGLPAGPVANMVRTLEARGIVVARAGVAGDGENADLDAFSHPHHEFPLVLLSTAKGDHARSRFDAAHELGHLTMHADHLDHAGSRQERQADAFAAAFLMPAGDIHDQLPAKLHWPTYFDLKAHWRTSLQALVRRAYTLGRISQRSYTQAAKHFSARGWRTDEPVHLGVPEMPSLLNKALELLATTGMTHADLADEADIPLEVVGRLLDIAKDDRPQLTPRDLLND